MREFISAALESDEDPEVEAPTEFSQDGEVFRAYRPTGGQVAVLLSKTASTHATAPERVAAMIDFFAGVLDEESHQILVRRLMDRNDKFELEDVNNILVYLMEEWAARPTKSPSASTSSQRNGGRKSTGGSRSRRVVEEAPSTSAQLASAI
jgi:hypothetical protein